MCKSPTSSSTNKMASVKSGVKALYGSKFGKILPVLIIAGLVATASASVFVNYYASGTVTASTNNVTLVAGGDSSSSCTGVVPCVHVAIASPGDYATISMNLGNESTNSPQPQSYFTDVLQVHNAGTTARSVTTMISSATETGTFYGSLAVYYCTSNPGANIPSATYGCTSSAITSNVSSPVTVASGVSLPASGTGYVAISGWAISASSSLAFDLQFQWA